MGGLLGCVRKGCRESYTEQDILQTVDFSITGMGEGFKRKFEEKVGGK